MNIKTKKFELHKETLAPLSHNEAENVQGGGLPQQYTQSVLTLNDESGCVTRCGRYYCIC